MATKALADIEVPPPAMPSGPADDEELARFAGEAPPPFLAAAPVRPGRDAIAAYRRAQVRGLLADGRARVEWLAERGVREGLAVWRPLPWDSALFGFQAARLDLLAAAGDYTSSRKRQCELLARVVDGCRAAGVRHLTARVPAAALPPLHALEQTGFEMLDGIQTFALAVGDSWATGEDGPCHVAPVEPGQLAGVLEIARQAYTVDRFHADPALPPGAAACVHERWMENACRESMAGRDADCPSTAVLAASRGNRVWGYVSVRCEQALGLRVGTIVLVATAAEACRRGVARQATGAALAWMRRHAASVAQVGTQLANIPAARLYESCGFRLAGVDLTFRKLL